MPLRTFKLKRGDRHVSHGSFVAPIDADTQVYEVEFVGDPEIQFLEPHVPCTLDGTRSAVSRVLWFPEADLEEVPIV